MVQVAYEKAGSSTPSRVQGRRGEQENEPHEPLLVPAPPSFPWCPKLSSAPPFCRLSPLLRSPQPDRDAVPRLHSSRQTSYGVQGGAQDRKRVGEPSLHTSRQTFYDRAARVGAGKRGDRVQVWDKMTCGGQPDMCELRPQISRQTSSDAIKDWDRM